MLGKSSEFHNVCRITFIKTINFHTCEFDNAIARFILNFMTLNGKHGVAESCLTLSLCDYVIMSS